MASLPYFFMLPQPCLKEAAGLYSGQRRDYDHNGPNPFLDQLAPAQSRSAGAGADIRRTSRLSG